MCWVSFCGLISLGDFVAESSKKYEFPISTYPKVKQTNKLLVFCFKQKTLRYFVLKSLVFSNHVCYGFARYSVVWKPVRNIGILGFSHKVWAENKLLVYTPDYFFDVWVTYWSFTKTIKENFLGILWKFPAHCSPQKSKVIRLWGVRHWEFLNSPHKNCSPLQEQRRF